MTGLKSDQSVDSDHFALIFNLSFQSPGAVERTITNRNWKSVDISVLRSDIANVFDGFTTQGPESAVESYNSVLTDIVDKHAPEKSRVIIVRADAPWYTSELVKEKRLRRKLEGKYNKTRLSVLTLIVNTSLSCAEFPKELKRTFLTPLIKKIILDAENLKNYRPVFNLSFISKSIERIVCVSLVNHLDKNGLYKVFQSAYRQLHSSETSLLRVQNDILQAVDSRGGAILVLLDLSAAFGTIDHEKLIRTLDTYCGIQGDPPKWFLSYLKGRAQSVQIVSTFSREQNLLFGVPQGSVLGPVLFTIYTTPLGRIIQRHGLTYHLSADDPRLYMAFKPSDVTSKCDAISRIKACVADIRIWMNDNFWKLNDSKTELLIITAHGELSKISDISIKVGDQSISPSDDPPRNLGVIFDSTICLDAHVAKLCRSINFNLYSVGKIRKYLDEPTA